MTMLKMARKFVDDPSILYDQESGDAMARRRAAAVTSAAWR